MSTPWVRRRRGDPRPSWEERHAALESVRERLRRQGAAERRLARVRRFAPGAALVACVLGAALAGPLLRAGVAARPELFAVRELAVVGIEQLALAEVARAAGLAEDTGGVTLDELGGRLARHPWIAGVRTARVSPDTVVVRIVERVPAAIWVRGAGPEGADDALLVDADGIAFAAAGGFDLPRLRLEPSAVGSCPPVGGCAPDARLAAGVELARAIERAGFARPEIELPSRAADAPAGLSPHTLPVLRLAGVTPRVLLGQGDLEAQLERLTRVLADVPASRAADEIDLRFAGQVVLRPPPAAPAGAGETPAEGILPASGTGGRSG